jgi:hypothetical protein
MKSTEFSTDNAIICQVGQMYVIHLLQYNKLPTAFPRYILHHHAFGLSHQNYPHACVFPSMLSRQYTRFINSLLHHLMLQFIPKLCVISNE